MAQKRDFLSITDLTSQELTRILTLASTFKKNRGKDKPLAGKSLIMIFEKPSLRTHASFDIGMFELGGHALYFGPEHIGLGKREPIEHGAKVLSRYGHAIMARVFDHQTVAELARYATVPVINGLSDLEHPCQILADLLTIKEHKDRLKGVTVTFVGDGENNVTHSLVLAGAMLGMHIRVASPAGFVVKPEIHRKAVELAKKTGGTVTIGQNPKKLVTGADVVYTDTWVSMGDEKEKEKRLAAFSGYQVDDTLMKLAKRDAIFMHDMPAYLGHEVSHKVFDSSQSVVYDQAENRLHAQKALLVWLLTNAHAKRT
jgi:ornithine carbamoyltransferase